jgi:hypothetical protein
MNLLKVIISIIIPLFFSVIIMVKVKAGLALSFALLFIPIFWAVSKKIDEKKMVCFFLIMYPLLPFLRCKPRSRYTSSKTT